jgi:hypothetical protein
LALSKWFPSKRLHRHRQSSNVNARLLVERARVWIKLRDKWRVMMAENFQISVPLPIEMIEWLEQRAAVEMTSRAAIVRRLVAQAWRADRDATGKRAA